MMFKNFVWAVSSIVLAAGLSFAPQSASAQTWTVTTTGQISYGCDISGLFGAANFNLAGMTYTQTITASIDPSKWSDAAVGADFSDLYGSGPLFTDTVTVGGQSFTFTAATSSGQQALVDGVSTGVTSRYDEIYSYQQGQTTNGSSLYVYQYAVSYLAPFVPGLSFSQAISQDVATDAFGKAAYFGLSGNETAYFQGVPNTITVNVGPVPEPGIFMMMICGLGVLGLVRRRNAGKPG